MAVILAPGHIYRDDVGAIWPGVTSILGRVPPWRDRFERVPEHVLEHKRQLGSAVHHATALDDLGWEIDQLTEEVAAYLEGWRMCRREARLVPLYREAIVWHWGMHYAGTLDFLGECAWGRVLLDVKTSPAADGELAGPQTWAYLAAARERGLQGAQGLVRRASIHLSSDGRYAVVEHRQTDTDRAAFLDALSDYHRQSQEVSDHEPDSAR